MQKNYIVGIFIGLICIAAGYYIWQDWRNARVDDGSLHATSTTTGGGVDIGVNGGGGAGYTVEQVPVDSEEWGTPVASVPLPDLSRVQIEAKDLDTNARAILTARLTEAQAAAKADPENLTVWNELALLRKMAEDYRGAETVWQYLTKKYPGHYLAYLNLGNLYGYYLKDVKKAEENYEKAVASAPTVSSQVYFQAADFYLGVMLDKKKALKAAQAGKAAMPNNTELKQLVEILSK